MTTSLDTPRGTEFSSFRKEWKGKRTSLLERIKGDRSRMGHQVEGSHRGGKKKPDAATPTKGSRTPTGGKEIFVEKERKGISMHSKARSAERERRGEIMFEREKEGTGERADAHEMGKTPFTAMCGRVIPLAEEKKRENRPRGGFVKPGGKPRGEPFRCRPSDQAPVGITLRMNGKKKRCRLQQRKGNFSGERGGELYYAAWRL